MRQGEVAPKGTWSGGAALNGVKAPEPIILPDPAHRFARTATRLRSLSAGHVMADWLQFMAQLAERQHAVAAQILPAAPSREEIDRATAAGMPAFGLERYHHDPAWPKVNGLLIDDFAARPVPPAAQAVLAATTAA
jgi:FdhE protein